MGRKDKLTSVDCFLLASGMTIGSGIITMTGFAIGKTGSGVFLAYILAALCIFIGRLPYVIIGSVIPMTSGAYVYSKLFSPRLGAAYLYVFFIGRITLAFLGTSFASYMASVFPVNEIAVAVGILTLLYLLNLTGLKNAVKVQNLLTVLLLAVLLSFIVLGMPKVHYDVIFKQSELFPNGIEGMLDAVSIVIFGVGGAFTLVEHGNYINDPQRVIPRSIFSVTVAIGGVLFGLVGLVGAGILPVREVANQPLTLVAREIYTSPMGFAVFIAGGALLAIITTINASYVWYYNAVLKGCQDGWFPKKWAQTNRFGVPYRLLTIFWLIGIIPILCGMNINLLSRLSSGLTLSSLIIPGFGILKLSRAYPAEWKNSRFYMSDWKLKFLVLFSDALLLLFIYRNFTSYPISVLISVLILFALSFGFIMVFGKKIIENQKNIGGLL